MKSVYCPAHSQFTTFYKQMYDKSRAKTFDFFFTFYVHVFSHILLLTKTIEYPRRVNRIVLKCNAQYGCSNAGSPTL